jgi:hypothetical protein
LSPAAEVIDREALLALLAKRAVLAHVWPKRCQFTDSVEAWSSEICMRNSAHLLAIASLILAIGIAGAPVQAVDLNDYPTSARADYVFGCMKANGDTQRSLEQCSCSIDIIASIVPYDRYVTAETVLRMAQVRCNLGGEFRSTEQARAAVDDLRRAQAEAEVRCF